MKTSRILSMFFLLYSSQAFSFTHIKTSESHWTTWVASMGWHFSKDKESSGAFNLGVKNFIYSVSYEEVAMRFAGLGVAVDHKGRGSLSISPFATGYHDISVGPELNFGDDGVHRMGLFLGLSF